MTLPAVNGKERRESEAELADASGIETTQTKQAVTDLSVTACFLESVLGSESLSERLHDNTIRAAPVYSDDPAGAQWYLRNLLPDHNEGGEIKYLRICSPQAEAMSILFLNIPSK